VASLREDNRFQGRIPDIISTMGDLERARDILNAILADFSEYERRHQKDGI
jgi:hypothetical protein